MTKLVICPCPSIFGGGRLQGSKPVKMVSQREGFCTRGTKISSTLRISYFGTTHLSTFLLRELKTKILKSILIAVGFCSK